MKKYIAILIILLTSTQLNAQSRGVKIGYIDMEYILQNVTDYSEAKNQLEQKAQKWKQDIEAKKVEIAKLKDELKTEKPLLTKELIDEREEEIAFQEQELLDFQQKRFGPSGDLITQKAVLVKPIQDQVFNAVQDIAEQQKYDFIFDKSSDLTMLFAAKRYDISDRVLRVLNRSEKRQQMSAKQLKEQEKKEALEDMEDENPAIAERRKKLEERKAARDKLLEDRKAAAEAKKAEQQAKRDAAAAEREAKKNGTVNADEKPSSENTTEKDSTATTTKEDKAAERARILAERKKELDDKRKKILEEREAAKKAREEKNNEPKTN
ncbi:MAG TPA: OmpH family outer membrane protein [Flavobacterium sp.]|jgi:Skp family chaperone for outer membrane proteins|uniref:OmpH family outer membrane protein n=1 Tax=Flavobacterium sp. TaxID=239 RepID=UPI002CDD4A1B|nr:OmpH family outer membrane protein [Flavobacterium sp.]HPW97967.1 OmpH family outer membrane protein [Flavobacterium sp.]HQA74101.1 OmpH family outer membrane protein [Flavobacterium sp.]